MNLKTGVMFVNSNDLPWFLALTENKNLKKEVNEAVAFLHTAVNSADSNNRYLVLKIFKPNLYKPGRVIDTFNREPDKFVFVVYQPTYVNIKPVNNNKSYLKQIRSAKIADLICMI